MSTLHANYDNWKLAYPDSWDDEQINDPDFICPSCKGESEICKDICNDCFTKNEG